MARITEHSLEEFRQWLICEERQEGTIQKYLRDVNELKTYLDGEEITKEKVSEWKEYLLNEKSLFPVTINSKIAAVGTYCRFAGIDCRVRFYKIQRKLFYEENKNLQKDEYLRLLEAANKSGNLIFRQLRQPESIGSRKTNELQAINKQLFSNFKTTR